MATAQQIAAWAAGAEARGLIPHRPIGPPDWQARGALLSFMLTQGYSNEHEGQLPSSDADFLAWADAPYVNDRALRRHNQAGQWDWNPMGCPGGNGCNDDDWMNHAPWPAAPVGVVPGGAPAGGGTTGGGSTSGGSIVGGGTGLPARVAIPGIGQVDTLVVGAAGLVLVLLLTRRR